MPTLTLKTGEIVRFDDEDLALVSSLKWHRHPKGYAQAWATVNGRRRKVLMHRLIMGLDGPEVDHRRGDGLDNRRENLRLVTHSQNMMNAKDRSDCRGVHFSKREGRWKAYISVAGKRLWLGTFAGKQEAVEARRKATEEHHGEFAYGVP